MKKAAILVFIVIVTIALTCALVKFLKIESFGFAWTLNFMLMCSALCSTETLKSPLTSSYFNEKAWERTGKIYESFGINFFRKLLVWTGWEKLTRKANPIERNTKTLIHLHYQTKQSELGHLMLLVIVFGFNVFVALKVGILKSLSLLILNVLFHLYPILLQRYNRPRIARAIDVSKRRASETLVF